jgi:hypothetical protein
LPWMLYVLAHTQIQQSERENNAGKNYLY